MSPGCESMAVGVGSGVNSGAGVISGAGIGSGIGSRTGLGAAAGSAGAISGSLMTSWHGSCFKISAFSFSLCGAASTFVLRSTAGGSEALTAGVGAGVGVFSPASVCGHTAAHRARQELVLQLLSINLRVDYECQMN